MFPRANLNICREEERETFCYFFEKFSKPKVGKINKEQFRLSSLREWKLKSSPKSWKRMIFFSEALLLLLWQCETASLVEDGTHNVRTLPNCVVFHFPIFQPVQFFGKTRKNKNEEDEVWLSNSQSLSARYLVNLACLMFLEMKICWQSCSSSWSWCRLELEKFLK